MSVGKMWDPEEEKGQCKMSSATIFGTRMNSQFIVFSAFGPLSSALCLLSSVKCKSTFCTRLGTS
jgi:hypothetical protein